MAKNPRKNERAVPQVARSIRKYGFVAPVVVWQSKVASSRAHPDPRARSILAGEPGFVPRDAPGVGLVPVRFHEFTDEAEANAYAIADNRLTETAEWDDDAPQRTCCAKSRASDEKLLAETGFADDELKALLEGSAGRGGGDASTGDGPDAPPATDALVAKWGCKPGDLWLIVGAQGAHRLLCGDCRRPEDVALLLDGARANVAFTSPPYARRLDERSESTPIPPAEYVAWFEAVAANVRQHLAADGSWFLNIRAHADGGERDLYVYDLVIAHKRRWLGSSSMTSSGCARVCQVAGATASRMGGRAFTTSPPRRASSSGLRRSRTRRSTPSTTHRPTARASRAAGSSARSTRRASAKVSLGRAMLIEVGTGGAKVSGAHPAEFPVGLPRFFLLAYSDVGDVVFEPFAGSGTTLLAAEQTGRLGRGMEISPRYCAVILERLTRPQACGQSG